MSLVQKIALKVGGKSYPGQIARAIVPVSLAVSAAAFGGVLLAQENNLGTSRQPLVGGTIISKEKQEEFALLELSDGSGVCSASLLRNGWAVTAAHCVELTDGHGKCMPDAARPGQNVLRPLTGFSLKADWPTEQTQSAVRVETFRPYDVAIIKTVAPFRVRGSETNYSRLVFQDGQFPYFGEPVGADLLVFGRGINRFATGSGDSAIPSQRDGLYRIGYARANRSESNLYWYPSEGGQMIAGGDSGGPSFAWGLSGYALVGVHALAHAKYVEGKPKDWNWTTETPEAADAPIAPVLAQIGKIIGPSPATGSAASPPPGFIGKFSKSPPGYQPIWVYGVRPNGDLLWYRKETTANIWQGPKTVGGGWVGFKDVIPAGGNRFYALTQDDRLLWYQHDGFNTGTFDWKNAVEIGTGWGFSRIFSGGDGIIYAVTKDGKLRSFKHTGYKTGTKSWADGGQDIADGWGQFTHVFSMGKGEIYAVKRDGTMLLFQHAGYETGAPTLSKERVIGSAWNQFRQLAPAGDGVIIALRDDGKLLWYKHRGLTAPFGTPQPGARALGRLKETWEGPVELGSDWQDFGKVFALLPGTPDGVR